MARPWVGRFGRRNGHEGLRHRRVRTARLAPRRSRSGAGGWAAAGSGGRRRTQPVRQCGGPGLSEGPDGAPLPARPRYGWLGDGRGRRPGGERLVGWGRGFRLRRQAVPRRGHAGGVHDDVGRHDRAQAFNSRPRNRRGHPHRRRHGPEHGRRSRHRRRADRGRDRRHGWGRELSRSARGKTRGPGHRGVQWRERRLRAPPRGCGRR